MDSSTNIFPYQSLDFSAEQIRLLSIIPSDCDDSQIECQLSHATIADKYVTLSYEWRDPKDTVPIRLNGQDFHITTNLESCIRVLRSSKVCENIKLWIDAICINQQDTQERNTQVSLMGMIYKSAEFSIAWLGMAGRPCKTALQVLQHDYPVKLTREKIAALLDRFSDTKLVQFLDEYHYIERLSVWERIWIVQEICLAKEILIIYGHNFILETAWTTLQLFMQLGNYSRWGLASRGKVMAITLSPGGRLWSLRLKLRYISNRLPGTQLPLGSTLEFLGGIMKATDERDYLYALMGLVTDIPRTIPDYNRNTVDIFCDFTFSHIIYKASLAILNTPVRGENTKIIRGTILPSWAFDPAEGISMVPGPGGEWEELADSKPLFSAGIPSNGLEVRWEYRRPTSRTLSLAGVKLDLIREITSIVNLDRYKTPRQFQVLFATGLPLKINKYFYTGDIFDSFWRTLVCDCNYKERRRTLASEFELFGRAFQSILNIRGTPIDSEGTVVSQNDSEETFKAAKQNIQDGFSVGRLQSFGYTTSGHMAMFPYGSQPGDHVCIFFGAQTPHIIREIETGDGPPNFKLIGPTYIHGWMDGEVFQWLEEGRVREERFSII